MMRALWYLVMLVLAAMAVVSGLDRESRRTPALGMMVPEMLRTEGHRPMFFIAQARGDHAAALDAARQVVRTRPVPSESLSLYSRAALAAGESAGALATMTLAAQRGWRDPVAQMAMAVAALQSKDHAVAAQRIDALWSTMGKSPESDGMTVYLARTPEGREAFAARLATGPHWQGQFLYSALLDTDPAALVDIVQRAERLGGRIPCTDLGGLAKRLERRNHAELAGPALGTRCAQ